MPNGVLISGVEYICRANQHSRMVYHQVETTPLGMTVTPSRIRHDYCEDCGCERTFVAKAVVEGPSPEMEVEPDAC